MIWPEDDMDYLALSRGQRWDNYASADSQPIRDLRMALRSAGDRLTFSRAAWDALLDHPEARELLARPPRPWAKLEWGRLRIEIGADRRHPLLGALEQHLGLPRRAIEVMDGLDPGTVLAEASGGGEFQIRGCAEDRP